MAIFLVNIPNVPKIAIEILNIILAFIRPFIIFTTPISSNFLILQYHSLIFEYLTHMLIHVPSFCYCRCNILLSFSLLLGIFLCQYFKCGLKQLYYVLWTVSTKYQTIRNRIYKNRNLDRINHKISGFASLIEEGIANKNR